MPRGQSRFPMVCLFHGDYGPADPAFNLGSASTWVVVDQDAVGWLYLAAFLFVILPYLIMRARARAKPVRWPDISVEKLTGRPRLPR
jgi:hypothetical protein